jgi:ribosomal protein L11 methyltransferase
VNSVDDRLQAAVGSVEDVLAGIFPIRQSPLVLVNVIAPIIHRLLVQGLGDLVMPGGLLFLSGMLEEQEEDIIREINLRGFLVRERHNVEDWVALIAKKVTDKI